MIKYYNF